MTVTHVILYIWAYFSGLLVSALEFTIFKFPIGAIALLGVGCVAAIAIPRYWRAGLNFKGWLIFGLIGCLAVFYCQWRTPKPSSTDISTLLGESSVPVIVEGQIESAPRQTRSQNKQFWLQVTHATFEEGQENSSQYLASSPRSGKLYVTIPAGQDKNLEPGTGVRLTGSLYQPKPAMNPGSFDFRKYLERQGCFAGLRATSAVTLEPDWNPGRWLTVQGQINHSLWQIRQRINLAFARQIENPDEAALLSGMVVGRKAVDLSPALSDEFAQAGMAHLLAASGFQVSLLLGVVLWITRNLAPVQQVWIGSGLIVGYIGLTGIQPSVLRAGLMGVGALLGRAYEQKTRPVGVLLAVALLLLLIHPIWMFDLGFQLSFLATLGLLVTAPVLTKAFDWLPSSVAAAVAIPLAAYVWTLPIQLFAFGTVSTYSILVNVLTTPLVILISLGGMFCAAIALISPELGSWVAWPLQFPTHMLIETVKVANALPGSVYAVGSISVAQLILLYGLFGWIWWKSQWRMLPWLGGLLAIALIFLPTRLTAATESSITFLNTADRPVVVVRKQGEVGLIHSGSESEIQFTVLPFLKKQGINRIDWAIATHPEADHWERWQQIANTIPITDLRMKTVLFTNVDLYGVEKAATFGVQQTVSAGSLEFSVIDSMPEVSYFAWGDRTWLMIESQNAQDIYKLATLNLPKVQVLQWSGNSIPADVLKTVDPDAVVVLRDGSLERDRLSNIPLYSLQDEGALLWQRKQFYSVANAAAIP